MCEICSNLTIKATDFVLVSLMLTLDIFHTFFSASIVDFEQLNVC